MSAADKALDALKGAMDSGQFDGQGPVVSVEFLGAVPSAAPVTSVPTLNGPTNPPAVIPTGDRLASQDDELDLALIIGLSVGAGVLLCCLCFGILFWMRRRNSQPPIGVIPDIESSVGGKEEQVHGTEMLTSEVTRDQRDPQYEYESETKREEEVVAEENEDSEQDEGSSSDSGPEDTQVV